MLRRGNKPVGTAARVIMLLILGVSIAIAAVAVHTLRRSEVPTRESEVMPAPLAAKLGQAKSSSAEPK